MSQENVDVVRRLNEPYDGEDIVPPIRAAVDVRTGPPARGRARVVGAGPGVEAHAPEIEWDVTGTGGRLRESPLT